MKSVQYVHNTITTTTSITMVTITTTVTASTIQNTAMINDNKDNINNNHKEV